MTGSCIVTVSNRSFPRKNLFFFSQAYVYFLDFEVFNYNCSQKGAMNMSLSLMKICAIGENLCHV